MERRRNCENTTVRTTVLRSRSNEPPALRCLSGRTARTLAVAALFGLVLVGLASRVRRTLAEEVATVSTPARQVTVLYTVNNLGYTTTCG
jgi:hypothetical protein